MKAKRFFAAALMALMVLGLFGACGKKENTSSGSASSGPDASELVNSYINTADVSFLDADGEATYRIVRPEEASNDVSLLGSLVFKTYKAQYNVSPAILIRRRKMTEPKYSSVKLTVIPLPKRCRF